ncbi:MULTISPECIES: lipid II flippase MurJ [unclassified Pseudonocardia]|uniref:lipid II flippase MurJ n=1 Tax=unclassified Pseudonocardia TaxID=2619320 RepID=UPI0001FFE129|nr:lipid II flippase MurJ [Pseudonocardia sp. Ae707_Ps1]OLM20180.1 putative peptidoglycan lipid II flippase MurJ [Pseudonocardia sp. Ae707_Ps1]
MTGDRTGPSTSSAVRDTATVAGWTLVSRLTGLLRVVVAGAVMGPTFFGNTFQIAYVLPGLVYSTVAGPVLGMVLVPAVVSAVERSGRSHARTVSSGVAFRVLVLAAGASVTLLLLAPLVAWVVTLGYPAAVVDLGEARRLAILLFVFVVPQIVLYSIAALGVAAQQAHGRFAVSAGAPAVENLGLIATVSVAGLVWGTGLEIGEVPNSMIVFLGLGSTLSVALHALLQCFGAARCGMLVRPSLRAARSPDATDPVQRLVRSVGVAAWPGLSMFVVLTCAGTVAGGVIIAQMAYAVYNAAAFLTGRAVSIAALPQLARAVAGNGADLATRWRQCTGFALLTSVPVLVALGVLATPVADVLARGRLAEPGVIRDLAAVLVVVAVAQLIGGVHDLGRQALFVTRNEIRARRGSEVASAATLATAALALLVPVDGHRIVVLLLAVPIGELAGALVVLAAVRATVGSTRLFDGTAAGASVVGAVVMSPVLLAGLLWYVIALPGAVSTVGIVVIVSAVAGAAYVLAVHRRLPQWGRSG